MVERSLIGGDLFLVTGIAAGGTFTLMGVVGADRVVTSSWIVDITFIGRVLLVGGGESRSSSMILATVSLAICFTASGITIPLVGLRRV
jgi:hypothetical protein